jgi:hypothetical protein
MSTYKILKNVLDFLEEKNELCKLDKLPDDEVIKVDCSFMEWNKTYPRVEKPADDNAKEEDKLKKGMDKDTRDIVKVTIDKYFDSDRKNWYRYIGVETRAKNKDVDCTIVIRWNNYFHPQVIRARYLFLKMDRDSTSAKMLDVDKNLAMIDPRRIDKILQGDDDGEEKSS